MACQSPTLPDVLAGLRDSERWHPDRLAAGQRVQLSALLQWAVTNVPYYKRSKQFQVAVSAMQRAPGSFWNIWRTLPVLSKSVLREKGAQLCAASVPESHMPLRKNLTSGSTGIPVEVRSTARTHEIWQAQILREHLWQGRDFSKRFGSIRYLDRDNRDPGGGVMASWGPPAARLYNTGASGFIHVSHPIDVLAAWLRQFNPHYLMSYPSVVAAIMDEMPSKPPALEQVACFAEPVSQDLAVRLRNQWNVRLSENYSANETGYIAIRCAEGGALHIQSESVLVEIIEQGGALCEEGQSGRVIITPLHNLEMPLIRYDIGDYATVGQPCRCGRGLPVISKVLGRVRNLARTPEGRKFWPVDLSRLREIPAVQQFQYVQTTNDTIQLRLVLSRPLIQDEPQRVSDLARKALGYPFNVEVVSVPHIERGPSGKFEEFLSLLPVM